MFWLLYLHCCVWAFSSCCKWGLLSSCDAWASCGGGFFCYGAQIFGPAALVVVIHRLSYGVWDLLRPGIKPVSPALAGGFLTTGPPGNP